MNEAILNRIHRSATQLVVEANAANAPPVDRASLNAYLGYNRKQKRRTQMTVKTACYGGIGGFITSPNDVLVNWIATGNAMENWECWHGDRRFTFTREEMISYLYYLANVSPYRHGFLSKTASTMVDNQYSIHPVKRPGNLVVAAMTAERQLWEHTRMPKTFLALRKAQPKANPDWHFILANMMFLKKGNLTFMPLNGGHCPLEASNLTIEEIQNFLDHNHAGARKKPFWEDHSYGGVTSLFQDPDWRRMGTTFYPLLKEAMSFPNGKIDLKETLFAWNEGFTGVKQEALNTYSLQENLPVFEEFYQQHFGGKA